MAKVFSPGRQVCTGGGTEPSLGRVLRLTPSSSMECQKYDKVRVKKIANGIMAVDKDTDIHRPKSKDMDIGVAEV